jgi:hypothetical protein
MAFGVSQNGQASSAHYVMASESKCKHELLCPSLSRVLSVVAVRLGTVRRQVEAEGLVDVEHEGGWNASKSVDDSVDRDPDLLGLTIGVSVEIRPAVAPTTINFTGDSASAIQRASIRSGTGTNSDVHPRAFRVRCGMGWWILRSGGGASRITSGGNGSGR